MPKINLLPKFVQNVIASGQVIDRPASVVKELVENSIDAGATKITIYVNECGLGSIAVVDNGSGIEYGDVRSAFQSYSTSKISSLEDLTEIKTMGFRGEALPAIASISNVKIWTKTQDCDLGTNAHFNFGKEEYFAYCASGSHGTKIEVTDLYGNVPNKKRFLKRPSTELSEITNIVSRLILANPYVSFKYLIDNNEVLSTMGRGLDEAVFVIYGRTCMENCFRVENEYKGVSVVGIVGESSFIKPNSTYQTVIVNGRYVKDDTIAIAVKNAFEGILMTREYPFFVLDITVKPEEIDVNIHPDKMEIKFSNKQEVYRAVYSPIKKHLDQAKILLNASSILAAERSQKFKESQQTSFADLTVDVPTENHYNVEEDENEEDYYFPGTKSFGDLTQIKLLPIQDLFSEKNNDDDDNDNSRNNAQSFINSYNLNPPQQPEVEESFYFKTMENNFSGRKSCNSQTENFQIVEALPEITPSEYEQFAYMDLKGSDITFRSCKIKATLFANYILAETESKTAIILIDQHAAHERILYDKYMAQITTGPVMTQPTTIPYKFPLTGEQREFIETIQEKLVGYGFDFEITDGDYLVVHGVPMQFTNIDVTYFIESLFNDHQHNFDIKNINKFYIAKKACKSAIRAGMKLNQLDINFIMSRLDENKNLRCPHGRPIAIAIKRSAIDKAFKRIL